MSEPIQTNQISSIKSIVVWVVTPYSDVI